MAKMAQTFVFWVETLKTISVPLSHLRTAFVIQMSKDLWMWRTGKDLVKRLAIYVFALPSRLLSLWWGGLINICQRRGKWKGNVIHSTDCFTNYIHKNTLGSQLHSMRTTLSLFLPPFYCLYLTGWFGDQSPRRPHAEQLLPLAVHSGRQRGPTPRPRHPAHGARHLLLEEWTLWHSR